MRGQVNYAIGQLLHRQQEVRDILSHTVTGKNEDYLQLNSTVDAKIKERSFSDILAKAGARALGGGLPGAAAMAVQVCIPAQLGHLVDVFC